MHTQPPRPSLPPPQLPPKVVAQTRIRVLQAELEAASDPSVQAALEYEIGALTEHKIGDRPAALAHYRAAHERAPSFRPALWMLVAAAEQAGDADAVLSLLATELAAARSASERASVLVDTALWRRQQPDGAQAAVTLLQQALDEDPKCLIAALLLERHHQALGDSVAADRVIDIRSAATLDPAVKSALWVEVAQSRERSGDNEGAIDLLRGAAGLSQGRWHALEELERVARVAGDAVAMVEALEGRAMLAAAAARDERNRVTIAPRARRRFRNADHALSHSAALWRQAAFVRAMGCSDPVTAQSAYDQALAVFPNSLLLHQEKLVACELAHDAAAGAQQALTMLEHGDLGRYAAALHFRVAEYAQQQQDAEGTRAALVSAMEADPKSPATHALLDDWQLDHEEVNAVLERLQARAQKDHDPDALLRAIDLAVHVARDLPAAATLAERAIDGDHRPLMWRMLLAAGYAADDQSVLERAAKALCELGVSDAEHSALVAAQHHLMRQAGADAVVFEPALRAALDDVRCAEWAPDHARLWALEHHDVMLLSASHRALAARATDDELRAAHLCAAARAALRGGEQYAATVLLREALDLDPTNAYAVALLEDLLLARGQAAEAVQILRTTAEAHSTGKRSEAALLHAGVAAEMAGDLELAARSYEESADKDPSALAPLWALRRLAEKTDDSTARLHALEGLWARERTLGAAGIAALELGELYDDAGNGALAGEPLRAALADRSVGTAAALSLLALPFDGRDRQPVVEALDVLQQRTAEPMRTAALRMRVMLGDGATDAPSPDALAQLQLARPDDRSLHLLHTIGADKPELYARRLSALAAITNDRQAATSILLASLTLPSDDHGHAATHTVAELSPDTLSASIAADDLQRAASAAADPSDTRAMVAEARTLVTRAAQSPAAISGQLRAAAARLLLRAEQASEAVALARAVVATDREDYATWETLRAAGHLIEDWELVVEACDVLAAVCEGEHRAQLLEEAAAVLMDQLGRPHDAEPRLRAALSVDVLRVIAFDRLHDVLADRDDAAALTELVQSRIDAVNDPDELVDLFYEQARLYRAAGDRAGALTWIESLLMMDEHHLGALGLAAEIHVSTEQWDKAASCLQRLARADGVPATQKRLSHIAAADFLERRLGDLPAAQAELTELASTGLADAALYARIAALALRNGDTEAAVSAHVSAAQLSTQSERAMHERMAGHLLRERVGDRARAAAAYRRALEAQPDDLDACAQLLPLLTTEQERTETLTGFELAVRQALQTDPTWASQWQKLHQLAMWQRNADLELLVLNAMAALGADDGIDPEERERLNARRPEHPTGSLTDSQLDKLRAPDDSGPWAELITHVAATIATLQRIEPATLGAERKHRVARRDAHPLRDAILRLVSAFGLSIDDFYGHHNNPRAIDVVPSDKREHDWIAGTHVETPLSDRDRFRVAQLAMGLRTGSYPLLPCPREEALDLLYGCAAAAEAPFVGVALPEMPLEDAAKAMSRRARKAIAQLTPALSPLETLDHVDAANQTGARAGLLVTANVRVALEALLGPSYTLEAINHNAAARDLLLFAVSEPLLALRRSLGVNL